MLRLLTRFHREVVVPDIERIVDARSGIKIEALQNEMFSHFDEIYRRFDRLESEYQALSVAVKRLEVAFAEDRASRKGMQSEIEKLKVQIADLQERLVRLESESHDA